MGMDKAIKVTYRPVLITALIYLVTGILLRIILWWTFGRGCGIDPINVPFLLICGLLNDLVIIPPLFFPYALLLLLGSFVPAPTFLRQAALRLTIYLVLFGLNYLAISEFFFFAEFNSRFNLVAVNYLIYPHEVFINIWQSYHVLWFLILTALLSLLLTIWISRKFIAIPQPSPPVKCRIGFAALHALIAIFFLTIFSTDTLAVFSNRVSNEISANGISCFFRALHTHELDYNRYYRTIPAKEAYSLIRNQLSLDGGKTKISQNLVRKFKADAGGLGELNLIVIVEESFGAQFIGAYGDTRNLTPFFDRLARQGILFSNAYASGTRTVRGLCAITCSIPPIPSEGLIKRPGSEHMANWGTILKQQGYQTSFFYGGHGLFDNMNRFYAGNGFTVHDIGEISSVTHRNIWGVCDEDLFRHALHVYEQQSTTGKPFFSIIMTTSNHQPYTFPDNSLEIPTRNGGRLAGIRYADYALGKFIEQARKTRWGRNTLFVIVADHDARVYGSQLIPMRHYRIPLLFLAPGRLQPTLIANRIGQIDIAPTIMGLLGLRFEAPFYGQDILHRNNNKPHPILVNHGRDVGMLYGDKLIVLGLRKSVKAFKYDATKNTMARIRPDPDLVDLTTAFYQTAYDLFSRRRFQLPEH